MDVGGPAFGRNIEIRVVQEIGAELFSDRVQQWVAHRALGDALQARVGLHDGRADGGLARRPAVGHERDVIGQGGLQDHGFDEPDAGGADRAGAVQGLRAVDVLFGRGGKGLLHERQGRARHDAGDPQRVGHVQDIDLGLLGDEAVVKGEGHDVQAVFLLEHHHGVGGILAARIGQQHVVDVPSAFFIQERFEPLEMGRLLSLVRQRDGTAVIAHPVFVKADAREARREHAAAAGLHDFKASLSILPEDFFGRPLTIFQ